jgi:Holliday junction DNA helicase RuvB
MSTQTVQPTVLSQEEEPLFTNLRAKNWDQFLGQQKIKKHLKISIDAAKKRDDALEHVLLYGPPGLGKTTMAHIIGKEMGVTVHVTSGPALERSGDVASILSNLESHDVLFIDEIHRTNKVVEESLYSAMEDYCLDIIIGKGPAARTVRLDLPHFTVIGATTRIGMLSSPLRDRFGVISRMEFYTPVELKQIILQAASMLHVAIQSTSVDELAKRSRGTPRIALRLLKRVRDVAEVEGDGHITPNILKQALNLLDVDDKGLDLSDRRYLETILNKFEGGPVGIETLAASLSEDIGTLEDVVEPYLLQIGYIKRTPRGRIVTPAGKLHIESQQT